VTNLFRPGLDDARSQLPARRQSLLDLFGQVDLLALPAMPVFPPRLADLTPDSLVDVIIEITQYIGAVQRGRNALHRTAHPRSGHPHTGQPAARRPPRGEELLLATTRQVEAAG
jgi:hypothetical protein